jgi:hypothetical protein
MIFRGSTVTSDWVFGRGKQNYLRDNAAVMKNIETRLRTIYSECFFDPTIGVQWFELLGQKSVEKLILAVKKEIYNCYGVVRVLDVSYESDPITRTLTVNYSVDTIFTTGASGSFTT